MANKRIKMPLEKRRWHFKSKVTANRLTTEQACGLFCLEEGLRRSGATLNNGKPVENADNAIKWLLEQCAAEQKQIDGVTFCVPKRKANGRKKTD